MPETALEKVDVVQRAGAHEVLDGGEEVAPGEERHVRQQIPEVLLAEKLLNTGPSPLLLFQFNLSLRLLTWSIFGL